MNISSGGEDKNRGFYYICYMEIMVEQNAASSDYKTPYKFTGKELDEETGLFLSVDPLADKYPGWNPYHYVHNNPIRLVDPDGKAPQRPPDAIIGMERLANGNFSHYSVKATVYIYGPVSSSDVASSLNQSVNSIWNNQNSPAGTRRRAGQNYSPVEFNINFIHVSVDKAKSLAESNTDKSVNFMNVVDQEKCFVKKCNYICKESEKCFQWDWDGIQNNFFSRC